MPLSEELRGLDIKDIAPATSQSVNYGVPIPKIQRLKIISADDWEVIVEQWASTLSDQYNFIRRMGGAGDKGVDVVGFYDEVDFHKDWDNYQCKRYDKPLSPSMVSEEVGKLIYHAKNGEYKPPLKYFFVAPKDIGTKLSNLISKPDELKEDIRKHWDTRCKDNITSTGEVNLEGDLLDYFESFDFSIFSSVSPLELLEAHSKTPFHSTYFGGGLPSRDEIQTPPQEIVETEFRYINQLFEAYSDYKGKIVSNFDDLDEEFAEDFHRQRERYYHAESLRNFARDNVPEGTFDNLKDEIYQGVVDKCNCEYDNGLIRMRETISQSVQLNLTSNPLIQVLKIHDKTGICHHLSNDDKLIWVKNNE
ncbi:ABC-three component system protein [Gracilimonas sp. Q87]|uniref:ABC-three component system protein n=1 Tax=Gracilimonas sp. Q87 TaxID=3384766 RepID=UPI0039845956